MKKFFLVLVCCFLLCGSAEAKVEVNSEDNSIFIEKEKFSTRVDYSYSSGGYDYTSTSVAVPARCSTVFNGTQVNGTWSPESTYNNARHYCHVCKARCSFTPRDYDLDNGRCIIKSVQSQSRKGPSYIVFDSNIVLNSDGAVGPLHNAVGTYRGYGSLDVSQADVYTFAINKPADSCSAVHLDGCTYAGKNYDIYNLSKTHTYSPYTVTTYIQEKVESLPIETRSFTRTDTSTYPRYKIVNLKSCQSTGVTFSQSTYELNIISGMYQGSPAISNNNCTITAATITDTSGTSQFMLGPDSEQTVTTGSGQTITTVKLSNPPVIIDWADFPG